MAVSSAAFQKPMCLSLQDSTHGCVTKLFKETVLLFWFFCGFGFLVFFFFLEKKTSYP